MRRSFLISIALHSVAAAALWSVLQPTLQNAPSNGSSGPFSVGLTKSVPPQKPVSRLAPRSEGATEAGTSPNVAVNSTSSARSIIDGPSDPLYGEIREAIGASLQYPISLQRRQVKGTVLLRLVLDSEGVLTTAEALPPAHPELAALAVQSAWRASERLKQSHGKRSQALEARIPIIFGK